MKDAPPTFYDRVPYPGYAQPLTHPDKLASAAVLFGMEPPAVETCRVLELGCGDGANLIPIAFSLPGCRPVGIDLAASAVRKGQAVADALGLKNVALRQMDVTAAPVDLGEFDYVIAHGLYSWAPPPVRDAVLAICRRHLAPAGVAYVSYNAYPGHHFRQVAREMMMFGVRDVAGPDERIRAARQFLSLMAQSRPDGDTYGEVLREEVKRVGEARDAVFFHDDLEPVNTPVYFHEFAAHAAAHGLQFLAEAEYGEMAERALPPQLAEALAPLAKDDVVKWEQFSDFARRRAFRRTLLCHAGVSLTRPASARRVMRLRVAGDVGKVTADGGGEQRAATGNDPATPRQFRNPKGVTVSTNRPLVKAALARLGDVWPRSVAFDALLEAARSAAGAAAATLEGPAEGHAAALADALLAAHAAGLVEFRTRDPALVTEVSPRPLASPLARLQAADGAVVTNLLGTGVKLEGSLARELLVLLDGSRDRAQLLRELTDRVASGTIRLTHSGAPVDNPRLAAGLLAEGLDAKLRQLGRMALLTG
jgi:SAM-dependent methyltransferase